MAPASFCLKGRDDTIQRQVLFGVDHDQDTVVYGLPDPHPSTYVTCWSRDCISMLVIQSRDNFIESHVVVGPHLPILVLIPDTTDIQAHLVFSYAQLYIQRRPEATSAW